MRRCRMKLRAKILFVTKPDRILCRWINAPIRYQQKHSTLYSSNRSAPIKNIKTSRALLSVRESSKKIHWSTCSRSSRHIWRVITKLINRRRTFKTIKKYHAAWTGSLNKILILGPAFCHLSWVIRRSPIVWTGSHFTSQTQNLQRALWLM